MGGDAKRALASVYGEADLLTCQVLSVPARALPELRQLPEGHPGPAVPASWLRHADDQTVLALTAVSRAVLAAGLDPGGFGGWGVTAAPRCLGRRTMAVTLERFRLEGVWGVSAQIIPHHSLHSPSGLLSCALKSHGPNVGAGSPSDALQTALAWLSGALAEGVWVVLTLLEPEPAIRPAVPGSHQNPALPEDVRGEAVALALVPPGTPAAPLSLRFTTPENGAASSPASARQVIDWLRTLDEGSGAAPPPLEMGPCGRLEVLRKQA